MGKKYMVRCDIEGVSGVVSYEQAVPGRSEFDFGKRMFMSDLLALVGGLNEGGADSIVIYDEHCSGRNVDLDALPGNVSVICGKPPYRADWSGGLDSTFSGMILLGYHSKYGTANGLLNHTYESDIRDIKLNGLSVGEIGVEAAIAGDCGVPLALMTGDSAGAAETRSLIPGAACVVVKESISATGALCYPAEKTRRLIRDAAAAAACSASYTEPYIVGGGMELRVSLNPGEYLEAFRQLFANAMTDGETVRLACGSVTAAWAGYWQMKNAAFAAMKG